MKNDIEKVVDLIRDAGGKIVGRTRLQKIACLLELAGEGDGFYFVYHHYGPYCEELTWAVETAKIMKKIKESEEKANWGGSYSIYTLLTPKSSSSHQRREKLATAAAKANSIELELAVTAAYLAANKKDDPWQEVALRKPEKAGDGRLEKAKKLYREFRLIAKKLPAISSR